LIDNGPGVPEGERLRLFDRFYLSPRALVLSEIGSGLAWRS
jgi:signal transduction histidine kinase